MIGEEELIYNYRLGNKEALSFLFYIYEKKVTPFYSQYWKIFKANGYELDDMKGFVRKCVLTAIKGYQYGDRNFNTYYSTIAYRAVIGLYRNISGKIENIEFNRTLSLSDIEVQERIACIEEDDEEEIKYQKLLEKIKELNPKDYQIISEYINGSSYKEIAEKMNLTVKSVSNHLQKIKKNLRKSMLK